MDRSAAFAPQVSLWQPMLSSAQTPGLPLQNWKPHSKVIARTLAKYLEHFGRKIVHICPNFQATFADVPATGQSWKHL